MPLIWIGAAFLVLKWLEVWPVADWSWWWVLAPLAAAFVWFEGLETLFGRNRREVEFNEQERRRRERVAQSWQR